MASRSDTPLVSVVTIFLDADDVYLPEKLAHQVAVRSAHPEAGAVYRATQ